MAVIDYIIVVLYFLVVTGLGFWYRRRASKNLESYFLGGRSMNWIALSMSGSVSNFDITGTMWIVSMLFLMGMKSMWVHWMWGCMMGAFCLAYMGKWVRRSGAITGADWMITRFGEDRGGSFARTSYAVMAIVTLASFIGYAFQGIGKFSSVYTGLTPHTSAVIIIGVTTLYAFLGGLFSVVVTDVLQTVILTIAAIMIALVAYCRLSPDLLAQHLPQDWFSLLPVWRINEFAGTENATYQMFGVLVILWVLKGVLMNAGGPAQMYDFQRFLAARNARDAARIGAAWNLFMVARWGMAMGIALLALTSVSNVSDPEMVMPVVLQDYIPIGMRGLVIAGLFSAFMSTFSGAVNSGASYIVRDIWQPFFKPRSDERMLIRASHCATIGIVVIGILIGYQTKSIAGIWNWMMMALVAGVVMPNFLRWYWWRFNGWGYFAGTASGILMSLVALFKPDAPQYLVFPAICLGSLAACILFSYFTRPVARTVLIAFYESVRPFGLWGPVRRDSRPPKDSLNASSESVARAILNTLLGIVAISGSYLFPMYLIGHRLGAACICLGAAVLAYLALAVTWYPYLPKEDETA